MAARLACATILDAEGRRDIAVPVGTTIAGLTAMLEIDLSDGLLRLTHTKGKLTLKETAEKPRTPS